MKLSEQELRLIHLALGSLLPSLGWDDKQLALKIQCDLAVEIAKVSDPEAVQS